MGVASSELGRAPLSPPYDLIDQAHRATPTSIRYANAPVQSVWYVQGTSLPERRLPPSRIHITHMLIVKFRFPLGRFSFACIPIIKSIQARLYPSSVYCVFVAFVHMPQ